MSSELTGKLLMGFVMGFTVMFSYYRLLEKLSRRKSILLAIGGAIISDLWILMFHII